MTVKRRIRLGDVIGRAWDHHRRTTRHGTAEQRRSGRKLGRVLADLGFVSESTLHESLAKHLEVPFVDLKHARIDREAVKLLPEALARRYRALCCCKTLEGC